MKFQVRHPVQRGFRLYAALIVSITAFVVSSCSENLKPQIILDYSVESCFTAYNWNRELSPSGSHYAKSLGQDTLLYSDQNGFTLIEGANPLIWVSRYQLLMSGPAGEVYLWENNELTHQPDLTKLYKSIKNKIVKVDGNGFFAINGDTISYLDVQSGLHIFNVPLESLTRAKDMQIVIGDAGEKLLMLQSVYYAEGDVSLRASIFNERKQLETYELNDAFGFFFDYSKKNNTGEIHAVDRIDDFLCPVSVRGDRSNIEKLIECGQAGIKDVSSVWLDDNDNIIAVSAYDQFGEIFLETGLSEIASGKNVSIGNVRDGFVSLVDLNDGESSFLTYDLENRSYSTTSQDLNSKICWPNGQFGERVSYSGSAGDMISGFYFEPESLPIKGIVVYLHGGPHETATDYISEDQFRFKFLEDGYAIFHLNYKGTLGFGSRFLELGYAGRQFETISEDIDLAFEAVSGLSAAPENPKKIVYGHSWGGYLALLKANQNSAPDDKISYFVHSGLCNPYVDIENTRFGERGTSISEITNPRLSEFQMNLLYGSLGIAPKDFNEEIFAKLNLCPVTFDEADIVFLHGRNDNNAPYDGNMQILQDADFSGLEFIILDSDHYSTPKRDEYQSIYEQVILKINDH